MPDRPLLPLSPSSTVQIVSSSSGTLNSTQTPALLAGTNLPGNLLGGLVNGKDDRGNFILKTPKGSFALKSDLPLPEGSKVVLHFQPKSGHTEARIVSINGKPPEEFALATKAAPTDEPEVILTTSNKSPGTANKEGQTSNTYSRPATPPNTAETTQTSGSSRAGLQLSSATLVNRTVKMLLQSPAPDMASRLDTHIQAIPAASRPAIPVDHPLQTGAIMSFRVVSVQPPTPAAEILLATVEDVEMLFSQPTTTSPSNAAKSTTTPNTSALQQILPTSTESGSNQSQVSSATTPPSAPQSLHLRPVSPSLVQGIVSHIDPESFEPVVHTPLGTFRLPANVNLPRGSTLTFRLTSLDYNPPVNSSKSADSATVTQSPTAAKNAAPLPELMQHWQSAEELLDELRVSAPTLADIFTQQTVPRPNNQLPASLFFFMVALKGGDVRHWLGPDITHHLEQTGKHELLSRLSSEFGAIRQTFHDPVEPNQWQSLFFPVYDGQELHQARFFMRREPPQSGEENTKNTRMVIDVQLSRFGEMQFDGLYTAHKHNRLFNLTLRTFRPLDGEVEQEIRQIFSQSLQDTKIQGKISFEQTQTFPLNPMKDVLEQHTHIWTV